MGSDAPLGLLIDSSGGDAGATFCRGVVGVFLVRRSWAQACGSAGALWWCRRDTARYRVHVPSERLRYITMSPVEHCPSQDATAKSRERMNKMVRVRIRAGKKGQSRLFFSSGKLLLCTNIRLLFLHVRTVGTVPIFLQKKCENHIFRLLAVPSANGDLWGVGLVLLVVFAG